MMRIFLLVAIYLICQFPLLAQRLKPGQPFPFETLPAEINELKGSGQPLIIEAFSSTCVACFTGLPKLKAMQDSFLGKLQIALVGKKDNTIEKTYRRFAEKLSLNFPVGLDSLFFARGVAFVPSLFWIDKDGIIRAVTGADALEVDNINLFLAGNSFSDEKYKKTSEQVLMQSIITLWGKDSVIGPTLRHDKVSYLHAKGLTPEQLYFYAFTGRTFIGLRDSLYGHFYPKALGEGLSLAQDRYNYLLRLSTLQTDSVVRKIMREDLARSLPYTARLDTCLMPVWYLVVLNGDTARIVSRNPPAIKPIITHAELVANNLSVSTLIQAFQKYYPFGPPILDRTGIKGSISINIQAVLSDRESLRMELRKNGMDLIEGYSLMQVVVLYEKQGNVAVSQ